VFVRNSTNLTQAIHDAPLKFRAPSLTKSVALDVGTLLFSSLNRVELLFSIILHSLICFSNASFNLILISVFVILSVEILILQPSLDERATRIIEEKPVESSMIHLFYVLFEFQKVGLLIYFAFIQF
jgi:hypothetical protein